MFIWKGNFFPYKLIEGVIWTLKHGDIRKNYPKIYFQLLFENCVQKLLIKNVNLRFFLAYGPVFKINIMCMNDRNVKTLGWNLNGIEMRAKTIVSPNIFPFFYWFSLFFQISVLERAENYKWKTFTQYFMFEYQNPPV